jgi:hypothetical protein
MLYTVLTAFNSEERWTRIEWERTNARRALTIWRDTASGVVSEWQEVIVWATRSTRDGRGVVPGPLPGCGDGGGEGRAWTLVPSSSKNEYDISLEMQSKLAIMSFSFRVSQANLRGSKISRGWFPA